jgi:hypothetical protein
MRLSHSPHSICHFFHLYATPQDIIATPQKCPKGKQYMINFFTTDEDSKNRNSYPSLAAPIEMDVFKCMWADCRDHGFVYDSEFQLYEHVISAHSPSKTGYRARTNLRDRIKQCRWQMAVGRPICAYAIRSDSHLPDHVISHFSSQLKPFPCPHV